MNHGSLFSGIGGFDLAAEWMGWNNIFHCEIEPFPRKILNYHFPNSITYEDIKQTDFSIHRGQIDILTGGFPCQPYSAAGQRKGKEDERHLWPEMLRVICEIQPRWVVGENVLGLVNWSEGLVFEEVQLDLEAQGYEVQAFVLPASAKNAPHRRDRVWFVAYNNGIVWRERWKFESRKQSRHRESDEKSNTKNDGNVTDSNGTIKGNRCGKNNEKKREIRRDDQSNVFGELRGDGNVTDTDSKTSRGRSRNMGCKNGEDERERTRKFFDAINTDGNEGNVTDTDSIGTQTRKIGEVLGESDTERQTRGFINESIQGTTSYTNSQRQEWERKQGVITEDRERRNKRFEQLGYNEHQWEKFPTQSPICGRDDGISTELDGITFSKWRRESIKGYGNAIVPQVVYEIFKTIEAWERNYL